MKGVEGSTPGSLKKEFHMKKMTGMWIDHRQAVLVSLDGGSSTVRHVLSDVESPVETSGGWRSGGTFVAQCISNEQRDGERRKNRLHAFYRNIIKTIGETCDVFIFGPGTAKNELAKEIERTKGPHIRISAVEACDKLTEPQTVSKVKTFFKGPGQPPGLRRKVSMSSVRS
jgi:hypothetical protein